jgi:hypothetical protein
METLSQRHLAKTVVDFFQGPEIRANLTLLRSRLPDGADLFVAGGAIRNLIIHEIHGSAPPTCDIDVFIGGLSEDFALSDALAGLNFQLTDLKGLRWHPDASAYAFDLCLLPQFMVIKRYRLPPGLASLMAGIDFSVNAAAYHVQSEAIFQRGCVEAVKRRIIDFNSHFIPNLRIMVYRSMLIRHKTGFRLSEPVFNFLKDHLDLQTLNWLQGLCRGKLGKGRAAAIRKDYDAVCTSASYEDYLASGSAGG